MCLIQILFCIFVCTGHTVESDEDEEDAEDEEELLFDDERTFDVELPVSSIPHNFFLLQ